VSERIVTVTMRFRIFDEDAFEMALEDLEHAEVFGEGESAADNTVEENIGILITNLDVIANYRETETTCFLDVGIERITDE